MRVMLRKKRTLRVIQVRDAENLSRSRGVTVSDVKQKTAHAG